MHKRKGFNPKRRIRPLEDWSDQQREELAQRVRYGGNPAHKWRPGDYGLTPPASPRPAP